VSCCCPEETNDGRVPGGGEPPTVEAIWGLPDTLISSSVFPAVDPLLSLAIPAGLLATDGSALRWKLGGFNINTGGGGAQSFPFLGIDTGGVTFQYGGPTANTPPDTFSYPFELEVMIARKAGGLCSIQGRHMCIDFSSALVGRGDATLANLGGPIGAADFAVDFSLAHVLDLYCSNGAAGKTWVLRTGTLEVLHA